MCKYTPQESLANIEVQDFESSNSRIHAAILQEVNIYSLFDLTQKSLKIIDKGYLES